MACLSTIISSYPALAFSGSRITSCPASQAAAVLASSISSYSGKVAVGCASGVDAIIRSSFSQALVFSVSSYLVGSRVTRASFAKRSAGMVSWCKSACGIVVAFPSGPAPAALSPSIQFRGHGSGTWGSVAMALGLGLPVLLCLPAGYQGGVPAPHSIASRFTVLEIQSPGVSWWYAP